MKINEAKALYIQNPGELLEQSCPSAESLVKFIQYKRGVIGLSGGVDSALVLELAVRAMGKDNVYGLMMPAGSTKEDLDYAAMHARKLNIQYKIINLNSIVEACKVNSGSFDNALEEGNLKARLRMAHLYAMARKNKAIVLGTGNKSEIMVGYFTKYGDGGVDILPIGQLYKTQVWKLAEEIGVPKEIVKRVPTAGLWPGQTDESELGIKYCDLDVILLGHELGFDINDISEVTNLSKDVIGNIFQRIAKNKHKIELPPMPTPKFEK